DVVDVEIPAADQFGAPRSRAREVRGAHRRHRALVPMNAGQRIIDVQGPRLAVGVAPVPVVQAEGGVAGLLDLRHQHAAADRVYRAGGQVDTIAGPRLEGVQ